MPISAPAKSKISATTMKRKTGLFSVDGFIMLVRANNLRIVGLGGPCLRLATLEAPQRLAEHAKRCATKDGYDLRDPLWAHVRHRKGRDEASHRQCRLPSACVLGRPPPIEKTCEKKLRETGSAGRPQSATSTSPLRLPRPWRHRCR